MISHFIIVTESVKQVLSAHPITHSYWPTSLHIFQSFKFNTSYFLNGILTQKIASYT